ncbi:MAG: alpha/beta fold hydrolase [Pseudomonadota bacterium]
MSKRKSTHIEAAGRRIHVTEEGTGKPLVLIHGGGPGASGLSNYAGNINALARDFRVIVPDLLGYGESDKPTLEGPRIAFYSKGVVDLLKAMDTGPVHLVGNSLGGAVAMWIAINESALVERLVMMGPGIGFPTHAVFPTEGWKHMAGYYAPPGPSIEKMEAFIKVMVRDPSMATPELVQARYEASIRPDVIAAQPGPPSPDSPYEMMAKEVHRLQKPTLIMWGRDDRVVPYDSAFQFFGQMTDAELHVIADCGHWVQAEKPDVFSRLVTEFCTRDAR